MVKYSRWTAILTLVICVLGIVYAAPNLLFAEEPQDLPGWVPHKKMTLGLDLQGGSHLLLEVATDAVITEQLDAVVSTFRRTLRRERVRYVGLGVDAGAVVFRLLDPGEQKLVRTLLRTQAAGMELNIGDNADFRYELSEDEMRNRRQAALEQSIEVVRRRVDESGVAEPTIVQQGQDRIIVEMPGVDDPERIKRLLGKTAKLTFHMVDDTASVQEALQGRLPATDMLLYEPGDDGAPNTPWVVKREIAVGGDRLVDAQTTFQDGQPVVSFRFDALGGRQFGELTAQNVDRLLAIVLDNQVISAPRIRQPIMGGNGIITGGFTVAAANDLAILLRAGALPAPLIILEERTVGPGLGADSIAAGKIASIVGMVLVVVFMASSYGLFGLMADVALLLNMALIAAVLSALGATLTLPGIAGIVLTIGMAVDANVLIFERIREEVRAGRTPILAIDKGYKAAFWTIFDSNVTTLIAAVLLLMFGTGPIRGFAVTLSIGIASSMFTSIMVTRLIIVTWLRRRRPQALPI